MSTIRSLAGTPFFAAILISVAVSLLLAWRTARRRPAAASQTAWIGTFASAGLVLGATLLRDGLPRGFAPQALAEWPLDQTRQFLQDPFGYDQILLNVALFVPLGFFLARLTARPVLSLLALSGFSMTLEVLQAVLGVGANDVSDAAANAIGAGIGTAVGAVVGWVRPRAGRDRPGFRHVALWVGSLAAVAMAVVVAANVVASDRAERLREDLVGTFEGTTLADFRGWEAAEDFTDRVIQAATPQSDGIVSGLDEVRVRYPSPFLGAQRCVFVTWRADGVTTQVVSGGSCTTFLS